VFVYNSVNDHSSVLLLSLPSFLVVALMALFCDTVLALFCDTVLALFCDTVLLGIILEGVSCIPARLLWLTVWIGRVRQPTREDWLPAV